MARRTQTAKRKAPRDQIHSQHFVSGYKNEHNLLTINAEASAEPSLSELVLDSLVSRSTHVTINTKMLHEPVAAYLQIKTNKMRSRGIEWSLRAFASMRAVSL